MSTAPKMMQLYIPSDRERAYALVDRAKAAGFTALYCDSRHTGAG